MDRSAALAHISIAIHSLAHPLTQPGSQKTSSRSHLGSVEKKFAFYACKYAMHKSNWLKMIDDFELREVRAVWKICCVCVQSVKANGC